jgi:hypothetical protein
MKEQDRARFTANIQWFNQFFDGIRNIYAIVTDLLPIEYFPSASSIHSGNFYFQQLKVSPSIPAYYAFLLDGPKWGLQLLTIIDASLIARNGFFIHEPSIIAVIHTQPDNNSWLDEIALNVVRNRKLELIRKVDGITWGRIKSRFPADFFAFQVSLDKFSDTGEPRDAVQRYLATPIIENLRKGQPQNS